jgi:hypothetical protein
MSQLNTLVLTVELSTIQSLVECKTSSIASTMQETGTHLPCINATMLNLLKTKTPHLSPGMPASHETSFNPQPCRDCSLELLCNPCISLTCWRSMSMFLLVSLSCQLVLIAGNCCAQIDLLTSEHQCACRAKVRQQLLKTRVTLIRVS